MKSEQLDDGIRLPAGDGMGPPAEWPFSAVARTSDSARVLQRSVADLRAELRATAARLRQIRHQTTPPFTGSGQAAGDRSGPGARDGARALGSGSDGVLRLPAAGLTGHTADGKGSAPAAGAAQLGLVLDGHRLSVACDGRSVRLTPTEWQLLLLLLRDPGQTLSQQHLAGRAFGDPARAQEVQVYVCRLRRKFERLGARGLIETVRGEGYRIARPDAGSARR